MWAGTAVSYAPLCRFGRLTVRTGICIGIRCVRRGEDLHVRPDFLSRGIGFIGVVIRS